jgi:hypothetical protein
MAVCRTENRYRNAIKPLKNIKPVLNTRLDGNHRLDYDYLSDLSLVKLEVCSAGGKVITLTNEHWITLLQRHYSRTI